MAGLVAKLDTKHEVALLPLADPQADELLPRLSSEERKESWHLVTTGGDDLTGGPGLQALLEALQRTRFLGVVLRRLRAARILDFLDRPLKRTRGPLGRIVADVQGPRRYP